MVRKGTGLCMLYPQLIVIMQTGSTAPRLNHFQSFHNTPRVPSHSEISHHTYHTPPAIRNHQRLQGWPTLWVGCRKRVEHLWEIAHRLVTWLDQSRMLRREHNDMKANAIYTPAGVASNWNYNVTILVKFLSMIASKVFKWQLLLQALTNIPSIWHFHFSARPVPWTMMLHKPSI